MTEQWQELKETIIEMRDNDGTGTQQEACKFLANLMDILEKQMQQQEPCEDAISRQAAIDTIESWLSCDDYNEAERHIMRATESILYDLPSVNPQIKTMYYRGKYRGDGISLHDLAVDVLADAGL